MGGFYGFASPSQVIHLQLPAEQLRTLVFPKPTRSLVVRE